MSTISQEVLCQVIISATLVWTFVQFELHTEQTSSRELEFNPNKNEGENSIFVKTTICQQVSKQLSEQVKPLQT